MNIIHLWWHKTLSFADFMIPFYVPLFRMQITRGNSQLSQELSKQLSTLHNCHVILLKDSKENNNSTNLSPALFANKGEAAISTVYCNVLDNSDLEQLGCLIEKSIGGIDLLIDNGLSSLWTKRRCSGAADDCRDFINTTSDNLRATINVCRNVN